MIKTPRTGSSFTVMKIRTLQAILLLATFSCSRLIAHTNAVLLTSNKIRTLVSPTSSSTFCLNVYHVASPHTTQFLTFIQLTFSKILFCIDVHLSLTLDGIKLFTLNMSFLIVTFRPSLTKGLPCLFSVSALSYQTSPCRTLSLVAPTLKT